MSRDKFGMNEVERGRLINLVREADTDGMSEAVSRQALILQLTAPPWPTTWEFKVGEGRDAADVEFEAAEAQTLLDLLEKLFAGKLITTVRTRSPMGGTVQQPMPIQADGFAAELFIPVRRRLQRFIDPPKPEPKLTPAKPDAVEEKAA